MSKKQPNNFLAPIVIAGITVGFFIRAYTFIFAKPKKKVNQIQREDSVDKSQDYQDEK